MDQVETRPKYRNALVRAGAGGWGRGLTLRPNDVRNKVLSVTGGGVHPVAARIAELTGCEAVDGFHVSVPDEQVLCVVINCGGTARIGVYPRKGLMTIDIYPGAPGGPLSKYITEDLFVSAVGEKEVVDAGDAESPGIEVLDTESATTVASGPSTLNRPGVAPSNNDSGLLAGFARVFVRLGSAIGYAVNTLLASGREAITITINTILPFMAYVSLLLGFVVYTGIANDLGHALRPLSSNIGGLILIGVITGLPFLSPILGPGAAVAQVIGILLGTEIGLRNVPVTFALPTLFAIDGQVGCDFIPVGLALGEAEVETVAVGVPAVLFSRLITSPLAVVLAWFASVGLK